jgi:hypothetical protein
VLYVSFLVPEVGVNELIELAESYQLKNPKDTLLLAVNVVDPPPQKVADIGFTVGIPVIE